MNDKRAWKNQIADRVRSFSPFQRVLLFGALGYLLFLIAIGISYFLVRVGLGALGAGLSLFFVMPLLYFGFDGIEHILLGGIPWMVITMVIQSGNRYIRAFGKIALILHFITFLILAALFAFSILPLGSIPPPN